MSVVRVNKWKKRPFVVSTAREQAWKGTHRTENKLHVAACSYESVSPLVDKSKFSDNLPQIASSKHAKYGRANTIYNCHVKFHFPLQDSYFLLIDILSYGVGVRQMLT